MPVGSSRDSCLDDDHFTAESDTWITAQHILFIWMFVSPSFRKKVHQDKILNKDKQGKLHKKNNCTY